MLRLVGRRLLASLPLLLVVTFAVFVLIDLAPGDAAERLAGDSADESEVEAVRVSLGLDRPVLERYADWVTGAVQGDLGDSLSTRSPVVDIISSRLGVTVSLILWAVTIGIVTGVIGGVLAALRPKGRIDRVVSVAAAFAVAAPSFWIGLVLVSIFAIQLQWLPSLGYVPPGEDLVEWARHLVLPAIALSSLLAAETARQLRGALVDVFDRDYILKANAMGLSRAKVVAKHALRNASVPVVTVLGLRVSQLIGGAVVIEEVFVMRGVGSLAVSSVLDRDIPLVLGVTALSAAVVVVVNLLVDLCYPLLNPKARPR